MLSVNNSMQFNHLHWNSTVPQPLSASVDLSMLGELFLYYCWMNNWINKPLINNERNKVIISLYGKSLHGLNKFNHNPTPNSHFFPTQKSVGLYSAHYGNFDLYDLKGCAIYQNQIQSAENLNWW